jgi:hypothetical protein
LSRAELRLSEFEFRRKLDLCIQLRHQSLDPVNKLLNVLAVLLPGFFRWLARRMLIDAICSPLPAEVR